MPACGTTSNGGGEGGLGSWAAVPARPWHSSAQRTKGGVILVPATAAGELEGEKEEVHIGGVATLGLSITHGSPRGI